MTEWIEAIPESAVISSESWGVGSDLGIGEIEGDYSSPTGFCSAEKSPISAYQIN